MVKKHHFEEPRLELKKLFGSSPIAAVHHLGLGLNQTDQTQRHLPLENVRLMAHS